MGDVIVLTWNKDPNMVFTVGLVLKGLDSEVRASEYKRQSFRLVKVGDDAIINPETITFPTAQASWGEIAGLRIWRPGNKTGLTFSFPRLFLVERGDTPSFERGQIHIQSPELR